MRKNTRKSKVLELKFTQGDVASRLQSTNAWYTNGSVIIYKCMVYYQSCHCYHLINIITFINIITLHTLNVKLMKEWKQSSTDDPTSISWHAYWLERVYGFRFELMNVRRRTYLAYMVNDNWSCSNPRGETVPPKFRMNWIETVRIELAPVW